jgi:tetratricopeptide (TPR) repeat protein
MGWKIAAMAVLLALCLGISAGWGQTGTADEAQRLNQQLIQLYHQGNYAEAARLGERALAIREKVLGPEHPDTAASLNHLARLYQTMGEYTQALRFLQRGLAAEPRIFANVFAIASEAQKLQFVEQSRGPYRTALSLIQRRFQREAPALRFGLELVLWHKGIVLEAQSQAQRALAANLEGKTFEAWQRLTQHRSTLTGLLLRGPQTPGVADYRRTTADLATAIAREEEFLAQRSGPVAQALALRQVTVPMVAERLLQDGA